MPTFTIITHIAAPPERCFDLARDLDLHKQSFQHTNEVAIAGKTAGLIELNEQVTWRAKHLGFHHTHTAKITQYDRPTHFRDEMIAGRFKSFIHDHHFQPDYDSTHITGSSAARTRMVDTLAFKSPFGILSTIIDALILKRYLYQLLTTRAQVIRQAAESDSP